MISKILDQIQLKLIWKTPERALKLYQSVPDHILQNLRLQNLKNTVKLIKSKSLFYSKLFEQFPLDVKEASCPSDLGNIFTTPRDLQTYPSKHFLCNTPHTAFETTGTTSRKSKRVFFSYREIEDAGRVGAVGLWRLGLRPEDRIASAFDYSFWVSGPTLKASAYHLGAFHIEAGRISPEDFYDRIKPYGCNVVVADPGWLVSLSQIAEKKGPWLMKLIMVGGENLTESSRKYIESVWQCKVLLSYGQTEAFGMIGSECSEQNGYHINDADLWPEINEPDDNGYGELVYTTLRRNVMPFFRYKSGDVTKIITTPCSCGARSPRLAKLKGRMDEMIVTGVGNIASWMMQDVIEEAGEPISEWQLIVKQEGVGDILELKMEVQNDVEETQLRDRILDAMKVKMHIAHQGILQGLVKFKLSKFSSGKLKRDQRKLKRIIDERNF